MADTILEWESILNSTVTLSRGNGSRCWKCHRLIGEYQTMIAIVFQNPERGVDDEPVYYHRHHCPNKFLKPKSR